MQLKTCLRSMFDGPIVVSEYLEDKPHVDDVSNIYSGALQIAICLGPHLN